MSDLSEIENETTIDPANSRKLFGMGCAALAVAVLFAAWRSPLSDPLQLFSGLAILVLGCIPGLLWARHSRPWFPCFEISALTSVVFYAVPLLSQYEGVRDYTDGVMEMSGLLVVGYLVTAILAFNAVKNPRSAPHWATVKLLPDNVHRYLPVGLLLNTTYLFCERFTHLIPTELIGTVRALCFGLGTITAFIYATEWGRDRLSRNNKGFFVILLTLQILMLFSQLYLITGASLLVLAAIGYTTTRRRLPWLGIAILLPLIAVLHNGKSAMREIYWSGNKPLPEMATLPDFFSQWIEFGLRKNEHSDSPGLAAKLAERASLFQMLCMSVDQVPSVRPHLDGESYIDIPAQVIPRFLWPERPSSLMANVRLAIYFNLIDPDNPFATSIAFGVISEAYVNFGIFGVLGLGVLTGFCFKHLALRSIGTPLFSSIGVFMVLLTAWSFQAELVLATWLASLFQACAISIALPLAWKKFFGNV